jgi:MraZ protein
MISHAHPRTRYCRRGENRQHLSGRPLPSVRGRALGEKVELFLSTFVNKVDRKGRVSVPATFRAAVADQSFPGIVVFPSFRHDALDGSGIKRMEEMSERLNSLDEFSEEHENLGVLFAAAQALPFDTEGRIVLPENLALHAHITDGAAFVGLGKNFQIWEPSRFADHQATLRERARQNGTRLPPLGGLVERWQR